MSVMREHGSPESDDVEALQTDIMRFMAILGFCLMVIFAMVQSLPQSEVIEEPQLLSDSILSQELDDLEERVKQLRVELAELQEQTAAERQEAQALQDAAENVTAELRSIEEQLKDKATDLLEVKQKLRRQNREVEDLEIRKIRLEALKREVVAEVRASRRAAAAAATPEPTVRDAPEAVSQSVSEDTKEDAAEEEDVETPEDQPAQAEGKEKGLSLIFASDTAFENLLREGNISFFLRRNKQYFRVYASGKVQLEPMNVQFYQMAPYTVPRALRSKVASRFTVTSKTAYGVTLDGAIERQLAALLRQHKSGKLVIGESGRVSHLN